MTTMTTANLVVNGDAETGTQSTDFNSTNAPPGWTTTGSFNEEAYSAGGSSDVNAAVATAIGGGTGYFTGGPNSATSSAYQTIDVSAYASAIDAGSIGYDAGGDFGGYAGQSDSMSETVTFLAADGTTVLGTATLGGVTAADRADQSTMLYREADGAVPVGTRFIKVELDATRTDGNYNDGYADNITFALTGAHVAGGYIQVSQTHDFSTDPMPSAQGILFDTGADSSATFVAKDFSAARISTSGTIVGDNHSDTLTVKFAASFDGATLTFQNWNANDHFDIIGSSGNDLIYGGAVNNYIEGGNGNDQIILTAADSDRVNGGAGNDTIVMNGTFDAADRINGGDGYDTIRLNGDYSAGLILSGATIRNVEDLQLTGSFTYKLTSSDANIAAGQGLTVDGSQIGAGHHLAFYGAHETDGSFYMIGSAGDDLLTGGAQNDTFFGGAGGDSLVGGPGADTFLYDQVSDSTSTAFDNLTGFDGSQDNISFANINPNFAGLDAAITSGKLTAGGFDTQLAAAVNASTLEANHAVLFSPSIGAYTGHTFLVIDANGTAGYQAGQDLVIELSNAVNMGSFGMSNFSW